MFLSPHEACDHFKNESPQPARQLNRPQSFDCEPRLQHRSFVGSLFAERRFLEKGVAPSPSSGRYTSAHNSTLPTQPQHNCSQLPNSTVDANTSQRIAKNQESCLHIMDTRDPVSAYRMDATYSTPPHCPLALEALGLRSEDCQCHKQTGNLQMPRSNNVDLYKVKSESLVLFKFTTIITTATTQSITLPPHFTGNHGSNRQTVAC